MKGVGTRAAGMTHRGELGKELSCGKGGGGGGLLAASIASIHLIIRCAVGCSCQTTAIAIRCS